MPQSIQSDQLESLDWLARSATRFDRAQDAFMLEETARILASVDPD